MPWHKARGWQRSWTPKPRFWGGCPDPPAGTVLHVTGFEPAEELLTTAALAAVPLAGKPGPVLASRRKKQCSLPRGVLAADGWTSLHARGWVWCRAFQQMRWKVGPMIARVPLAAPCERLGSYTSPGFGLFKWSRLIRARRKSFHMSRLYRIFSLTGTFTA